MPAKKEDKRDRAFRGAMGRSLAEQQVEQRTVAQKINVVPHTICNWKKSPSLMSLGHFRLLARELKFTDEEILNIIR